MCVAQSLTDCFPVAHRIDRDPGSFYGNDEEGVCGHFAMNIFPDYMVF